MELDAIHLARRQHGVIGRRQLLAAGLSGRQIERRLHSGSLVRLSRGVYALRSSTPSWDRLVVAAWIATVERRHPAAVGMRTAAALHGLPGHPPTGRPELIAANGDRHTNPFGLVMRRGDLEPDDVQGHEWGVLLTNPVRTVLDLAMADGRPGRTEALLDGALGSGLVTIEALCARFARLAERGKPGTRHVRGLLAERLAFAVDPASRPLAVEEPARLAS